MIFILCMHPKHSSVLLSRSWNLGNFKFLENDFEPRNEKHSMSEVSGRKLDTRERCWTQCSLDNGLC